MILDTYLQFLNTFFELLAKTNIDAYEFNIDHIAYYTSSAADFDAISVELQTQGLELRDQNLVDARRVALFVSPELFTYKDQEFTAIEIVEPLKDQITTSRWEHAELISAMTLEEILAKYPDLDWDTSRMNRDIFPMLKLKLNDKIQAKFPRNSVLSD